MTNSEFEKLKVGDLVSVREGELYVVKDDYAWGPPCKVCLVDIVDDKSGKQCQISRDNYMYWEVINQ